MENKFNKQHFDISFLTKNNELSNLNIWYSNCLLTNSGKCDRIVVHNDVINRLNELRDLIDEFMLYAKENNLK